MQPVLIVTFFVTVWASTIAESIQENDKCPPSNEGPSFLAEILNKHTGADQWIWM